MDSYPDTSIDPKTKSDIKQDGNRNPHNVRDTIQRQTKTHPIDGGLRSTMSIHILNVIWGCLLNILF